MEFPMQQLILSSIPPFLWAFMTFFITKANRSMDVFTSLFIFQLAGIPLMVLLFPFISPEKNSNLLLIVGLGILETFALLLYFYALRIGQLAIIGTLIETYVIITVFLSVVFLHESFYFLKFVAITAIVLGIISLGLHMNEVSKYKKMKLAIGVFPVLVAAFATGIYFFFVGISSRINGWYSTALGIRIMISLTIVAWFLFQRNKSIRSLFSNIAWKWILPAVFFDVIAFSVFNYALTRYEVSYVSVIGASAPIISTLLAVIFLKEKLTIFQITGFILVIAGIVALNIF